MVKKSWDLGIPLFSSQRAHMAGPWLLGFKIRKGRFITSQDRKIILPVFSLVMNFTWSSIPLNRNIFPFYSVVNQPANRCQQHPLPQFQKITRKGSGDQEYQQKNDGVAQKVKRQQL